MKAKQQENLLFPHHIFFTYFGILLLMSGIHYGLIVLGARRSWPTLIKILVPMLYWALVAAGLTAYARAAVKKNYDVPFRMFSEAAAKVAKGDFTARVDPPAGDSRAAEYFGTLAANFNKMAEDLGNVETLRTDFVSTVSHELKTPLAGIQNYGTMLQQPGLSEEQRLDYAREVTAASRRMASLITNILKLNKLENQRIAPAVKTYDLGEQLCECLLGFEDAWERKGLEVETDLEDGILVDTDPELLALVWNNLFSNAIKFTEPGGTISLKLTSDGDWAEVTVADTGCGISEDTGKRIFDKFYQGDTSHATQGNGLGLALVKRVIDLVSGEIRVSSQVGKGSAFTVRLARSSHGES